MKRCRYGYGQRWACHRTATHLVTTSYGTRTEYCEAHAKPRRGDKVERLQVQP